MFAPTKIWRHWHRCINQNQRRYATASAIAATALPALVQARGHRVAHINEIPVVVDDGIEKFTKTKDAVRLLKQLGVYTDVQKSAASRKIRSGQGKMRNRRHVQRRGPLIVFNKDEGIHKAFRNLPGVNLVRVDGLNLLQLAPGSHLGRLCVWSQSAFKRLDAIFGSHRVPSVEKSGYNLPRSSVTIPDLARLLKSNEIQSVIRPRIARPKKAAAAHNPLTNIAALTKLNPYAATFKRLRTLASTKADQKNAAAPAAKQATSAAPAKGSAAIAEISSEEAKARKIRGEAAFLGAASAFMGTVTKKANSK